MGDLKGAVFGSLLLACCWAWPLKHSINGLQTRFDVADYPPVQRLPRDFKVISYHLTIHPYFDFPGYKYDADNDLRFEGIVEIKIVPLRRVSHIAVNSQNLDLQSVWVFEVEENYPVSLYDVNVVESAQLVNISTVTPLREGKEYSLKIQYSGPINPSIEGGLYYSNYHGRRDNGTLVKRTMIATFFEPFRSRKVFPNFDDPYFKAVFNLKLRYPKNANVFHNVAEVKEEKNLNDYKEITFKETPLMSSYLLAFAVGEFDKVTQHTKRNIPVSSISFPEISRYLNQSAVTGAHCVDAMEELVGVPYALPKLDNIEMLYMGSSSAMENWGLIVYTRFLSQHPFATPATARYTKRSIMCHEIAHQWFGDLITADYWGQEFLHESFAAYFQNVANLLFQENDDDDENFPNLVATNSRTAALGASENGDHAVVADKAHFDSITYASGGSMLTMTDYVLGKSVFRTGLKRFLEKKQYGSATHEDLFAALSEANADQPLCGNITVRKYLNSFFLQPKHPVVSIYKFDNEYEIYQRSSNKTDPNRWFVPLFVSEIGKEDEYSTVWLLPDNTLCGPKLDAAKNYIFNTKGRSFARFVYSNQYLASLKEEELKALSEESQIALVHDVKWSLAERKIAISDQYLGLITTLTKDVHNVTPFVALEAIDLYERFKNEFVNTYEYDLYTKYFGHFLVDLYSEQLWDDKSVRNGFYSKSLLYNLVVEDLANARNKALEKFGQFRRACSDGDIETCNALPADTRRAVYCAGAVQGNAEDVSFLKEYLQRHDEVKDTLFYFEYEYADINIGLACLNPHGLAEFLDEAVENSYTKFFEALLENKRDYVARSVEKFLNHVDLVDKFDEKPEIFEKVLAILTKNYTDGRRLYQLHGINELKHNMALFKVLAKAEMKIRDVRKAEDDKENIRDEVLRYIYNKYVPIGKLVWSKRLPQYDYEDLHYTLNIEPDYSTQPISTYNGEVTIEFTGTKSEKTFHINSHRHVIKQLTFLINNLPQTTKVSRDYENGIVTITAGNSVQKYDKVTIRIEYTGYIFDEPKGFFFQRNENEKRSNRFFLSTWFPKGPAARSFAPCLDEPNYKATWDVAVTHPSELVALSNGAHKSTIYLGNNFVKTTFKTSPKISSYLLGVTIGPYAAIQKSTDDGVEVKVWAEVGLEKYGYVALNATVSTLNFLGEYLGLSYKEFNDKLDVVLNPEWNGFGTENFGVIIGNANVLLYKETVHDLAHKRNAFKKAAHEVAHQWFGNTVSFKFFNYGFLSEGFASFFETEVVNSVLSLGEAETVHNLEAGLHLDENLEHLDTVITADNKVYDTLDWTKQQIYTKAQGVLHSLKSVVGKNVFKEALQRYIRKFKGANVDDQDLWGVFQELADANNIRDWNNQPLSVKKFMDPYTRQVSYPITVLQLEGNTATVVDTVNLHNETDLPPSDFAYAWHTPIISAKGAVNWAEVGSKIEDYKLVGYQSYTRVIYEGIGASGLDQLYSIGSEIQRAKLISDYFNLFKSPRFSERVGLENLLSLLKNLKTEESPLVWSHGAEAIKYVLEKSKVDKTRLELAKTFVGSLINGRTGTNDAGQWKKRLPHILNVLAVRVNDASFKKSAQQEFEKFVTKCLHNVENVLDCEQTHPEHRVAVFASALGEAENVKELQSLRDFAAGLKNKVFARKLKQLLADSVAHSLLSTNNLFFVRTAMGLINDQEEDVARFFETKSSFDDTQNELRKWIGDHGSRFLNSPHFKNILKALVKDWASKEKLEQFDNIRWPSQTDPNLLQAARSAILKNIKWEEDYGAKLSAWLTSYSIEIHRLKPF